MEMTHSTPKRGRRIRWEDVDRSRCDIQVALEALEQAKALKSPRTLGWYRSTVRAFREWLSECGYPTIIAELTPEIVQTYLADEAQRNYRRGHRIRHDHQTGEIIRYLVEIPGRLSEHSLNTTIRCLRAFGRWLVKSTERSLSSIAHPAAVPSNAVRNLLYPKKRATLGVKVREVTLSQELYAKTGQSYALLLVEVTPNGAADAAGLTSGDVLLSINGVRLDSLDDLLDGLEMPAPNTAFVIEALRGGQVRLFSATPDKT